MKKKLFFEISIYIFLVSLLISLVFVYKNQTYKSYSYTEIFCDFETTDSSGNFFTTKDDYKLNVGNKSTEYAYSGKQSLKINDYSEFQNICVLKDLIGPYNITVQMMIKEGSEAFLVMQGETNTMLYNRSNTIVKTYPNGWQLINLSIITDANFNDNIKIYIYNPKKQTTYIDDVKITLMEGASYPKFKDEEPLLIYIEKSGINKLNKKKEQALEKGVLITEEDSWVNAIVYGNGKMMEATVRLKGDWLDHLVGDKISLRIKLKDDSWNGMRVFSIQTPYARGFTNEWIMHLSAKNEDLLATRYDFVPVYLNGKSLGIYAYEEHFQKELIENSKRREGPIIKFAEEDFWLYQRKDFQKGFPYEQSVIEPFGENQILKDTTKYNQFITASNLLHMFRVLDAKASDIFDVKKTAKWLAFVNARNATHAMQWHNMRFYYNPVLSRLEPIAFDMFAGPSAYENNFPIWTFLTKLTLNIRSNSFFYLMADEVFKEEYLKMLDHYTNVSTHQKFLLSNLNEYNKRDSLLKIEFKPYNPDTIQFTTISQRLNNLMPIFLDSLSNEKYLIRIEELNEIKFNTKWPKQPEIYADKYIKCYRNSDQILKLVVSLNQDFIVTGIGTKDGIELPLEMKIDRPETDLKFIKEITLVDFNENYNYLYFTIEQKDTVFKSKIYPWAAPVSYNPRNDIAANATDISQFTDNAKREIRFSGNLTFDNHVYIPVGYTVIFEPGTSIDIINYSSFISNSTVLLNGTKENPIKIYSSDKTANGFTILQADEQSVVNYTEFNNLNTLNYNGWVLTGAVSFYESDVIITNSTFSNNHCEDMINTIRCDFLIKDCIIKNTFGDSHDSDFCTGTLDNCIFTNNGNDAIDFSTSDVEIINCTINGARDKGISVGENTQVVIKDVVIKDVNIGIASKDLSHAEIDNCEISNANYGFVLLQKKPEFGPATITVKNCTLKEIWTESLIEQKSTLILNGKTFKGKNGKLKALFYE